MIMQHHVRIFVLSLYNKVNTFSMIKALTSGSGGKKHSVFLKGLCVSKASF